MLCRLVERSVPDWRRERHMHLPMWPDQWAAQQPLPFNEYVAHLGDASGAQQRFQQGGRPSLARRQPRPPR